jgi:signal peptidase II
VRAFALAALVMFALDQGSKWAVVHWLGLKHRLAIDVLPPLLNFRMGWNDGINFGLLSGHPAAARWLLVALALAICAWVTWFARRDGRPRMMIAAGVLVGGALGNVADRLVYGAVADFLNMSCCGITNPFAFNIADIGVFAGAIALVLWSDPEKTR